ncbi:MAG: transposase [Deltaproteobacteria bacterium]|nr:transposase [Deltaproteobacteria bacterium]
MTVAPRNTSRECPNCGCISKQNRRSQARFRCTSCGLLGHADVIAAVNINRRALVNAPYVSDARLSPPASAGYPAVPWTSYRLYTKQVVAICLDAKTALNGKALDIPTL